MTRLKIENQTEYIHPIKSIEAEGIQMGVLENGTPFLTGRGLATMCGISPSTLNEWGEKVPLEGVRLRKGKIAELLSVQGFEGDRFFTKIKFEGQESNAYPDAVCMAFLEYYAFEAGARCTDTAKNNYRLLARKTLRNFIYTTVGYNPQNTVSDSWRQFHDRLTLNPIPLEYFSIFKETADMVLCAITEGLVVDSNTVPDISIGTMWSKYWNTQNLRDQYGIRVQYLHEYPDYFPQAKANGDIYAYIYPIEALGLFRRWLQTTYLPEKFPNYLKNKVRKGDIPASSAELLIKAVTPKKLPIKNKLLTI